MNTGVKLANARFLKMSLTGRRGLSVLTKRQYHAMLKMRSLNRYSNLFTYPTMHFSDKNHAKDGDKLNTSEDKSHDTDSQDKNTLNSEFPNLLGSQDPEGPYRYDPCRPLMFNHREELVLFSNFASVKGRFKTKVAVPTIIGSVGSVFLYRQIEYMLSNEWSKKDLASSVFKFTLFVAVPLRLLVGFLTAKSRIIVEMRLHKDGEHVT